MYFPPNQITTNLFTNDASLVFYGDKKVYKGYYFATSDGRYYTGKNPNDGPNQLLELQSENYNFKVTRTENLPDNYYNIDSYYYYAKGINENEMDLPAPLPTEFNTPPNEENYKNTEYQRYFVKKINEMRYVEISPEQFDLFIAKDPSTLFELFFPFQFPWLITGKRGDVINVNKKTIERVSRRFRFRGLTEYFKNKFDQYFKYQKGEYLKTDGTEFLNKRTGKRYIGLYHVHPEKGPMVGAQHVPYSHDFLIPISGSNQEDKLRKAETQRANTSVSRYSGGY